MSLETVFCYWIYIVYCYSFILVHVDVFDTAASSLANILLLDIYCYSFISVHVDVFDTAASSLVSILLLDI